MRFTTGQEPGDRAELGHDRLPDNLDERMMAASGCTEPVDPGCVEEGSMISNLPLLFADGYPTSLEKITLPQLERFITFMVQCSFGHDTAKVIKEPQWWPKEIKFTNPFVRPRKINENWMGNLKKLVFRCYTYHRSEYLLRFCSHLAQHPRDKLEYVDNWDSTTSLFHKSTGKLLVTFRNENMNYDKKIESPRRLLLPRNGGSSRPAGKTKPQQEQLRNMLQQPVSTDDIYLCDNCDAELDGYKKMKEHEKMCCDQEQSSGSSRPVSPELTAIPQARQDQFLDYFGLSSNERKPVAVKSSEDNKKSTTKTSSEAIRSSRRIRGSVNLARCPTIPFSSPAGIAMAKKSRTMTEGTQQERLERIERYLIAPPLNNGSSRPRWLDRVADASRWTVSYKPNRDKPPQDDYVHQYKFYSSKGRPILNIRSQILCVACRKAIVPLKLLTPEKIEELKNNPQKYERPKPRGRKEEEKEEEEGKCEGNGELQQNCRTTRPAPKSKRRIAGVQVSAPAVVSQKRKIHGDDPNDSIIIIDGEAEQLATLTPITAKKIPANFSPIDNSSRSSNSSPLAKRPAARSSLRRGNIEQSLDMNLSQLSIRSDDFDKSIKTAGGDPRIEDMVAVIDLCSSDSDDDNLNSTGKNGKTDENRDPLKDGEKSNLTANIIDKFIPKKIQIGSCVFPADSTSDWLKRIAEPCQNLFE